MSYDFPVYFAIPLALAGAVAGGLAAGALVKLVFKVVGHDGYSVEATNDRRTRKYMERLRR